MIEKIAVIQSPYHLKNIEFMYKMICASKIKKIKYLKATFKTYRHCLGLSKLLQELGKHMAMAVPPSLKSESPSAIQKNVQPSIISGLNRLRPNHRPHHSERFTYVNPMYIQENDVLVLFVAFT